jgi:hypothetical protein
MGPRYVHMNLEPAARDALRAAKIAMTTPLGREVTLSEALTAAVAVALAHPDEYAAALRGITPPAQPQNDPAPGPVGPGPTRA